MCLSFDTSPLINKVKSKCCGIKDYKTVYAIGFSIRAQSARCYSMAIIIFIYLTKNKLELCYTN